MGDFNFFQTYTVHKKKSKKNFYFSIGMSIAIVLFIISTYGINTIKITRLKREISSMEEFLNSKENNKKLADVEKENKKLKLLSDYRNLTSEVNKAIENEDFIKTAKLKDINSTMPENVFFINMNMNGKIINLNGFSGDRNSIAELEYNLKAIEFIKDVHVQNISTSDNSKYSFNLKCLLKDVDENEGD